MGQLNIISNPKRGKVQRIWLWIENLSKTTPISYRERLGDGVKQSSLTDIINSKLEKVFKWLVLHGKFRNPDGLSLQTSLPHSQAATNFKKVNPS